MPVPHPSSRSELSAPAQWIHLGQVVLMTQRTPRRVPPAQVLGRLLHIVPAIPRAIRHLPRHHLHKPAFLAPSLPRHTDPGLHPACDARLALMVRARPTQLTRFRSARRTADRRIQFRQHGVAHIGRLEQEISPAWPRRHVASSKDMLQPAADFPASASLPNRIFPQYDNPTVRPPSRSRCRRSGDMSGASPARSHGRATGRRH